MFNRPKVLSPNGTSPKRSPFTDIQNLSPVPGDEKESKGLDNFDWNRKLNLKKSAKPRPKKKFVIEVAEEKNNCENYSPNSKTAYSAFGRNATRNRFLSSKKSDCKDTVQFTTDEDISISYDEASPRFESKDVQHENLLRIAHQLSPSSQALSSNHSTPNSVKGPPTDMVSPVYTPTLKRRSTNSQLLVGSPLLNVSKREIEVSPQTPDLSVSPSDQKTPPMDDSSDSKSCATSREDKDDSYGEDHGYTEDTYDHNQYDANNDFNEEAYNEGYTDEQYQYHEGYEYDHNENTNDFQITNQEYYSDMYQEVAEEKHSDDDMYTTTSHTSLKALTPVKLRACVTVVTEEISSTPKIETKSLVDSPQSISSSLTNFSTDIEIEQLFSKVRHNRIGDVKAILDRGVNARLQDSNGNSLLHICAQNNLKKMASIVLEFGADINAENKKGITALDYCDNYHFDKLGDWFVQNGGDNGHANLRI